MEITLAYINEIVTSNGWSSIKITFNYVVYERYNARLMIIFESGKAGYAIVTLQDKTEHELSLESRAAFSKISKEYIF